MITFASLAIFSGLSLNLLLQFALGTAAAIKDDYPNTEMNRNVPFLQLGILFLSVLFLWVFFSFLVPPFWNVFALFFLFFPLSALVCFALEALAKIIFRRFFPQYSNLVKIVYPALTAYEGLVPISLIITITLARSFSAAIVFSLFFSIGNMTAMLILNEIHRRSDLEWVPGYIRGTPLMLISMGFLSIISTAAAIILFRILEIF